MIDARGLPTSLLLAPVCNNFLAWTPATAPSRSSETAAPPCIPEAASAAQQRGAIAATIRITTKCRKLLLDTVVEAIISLCFALGSENGCNAWMSEASKERASSSSTSRPGRRLLVAPCSGVHRLPFLRENGAACGGNGRTSACMMGPREESMQQSGHHQQTEEPRRRRAGIGSTTRRRRAPRAGNGPAPVEHEPLRQTVGTTLQQTIKGSAPLVFHFCGLQFSGHRQAGSCQAGSSTSRLRLYLLLVFICRSLMLPPQSRTLPA